MTATVTNGGQTLRGIAVAALYVFAFWRIGWNHRANKTIVWGSMTIGLLWILAGLYRLPHPPYNAAGWLGGLLFLMAVYTLVLALRDVVRWARRPKKA